MAMRCYWTRPHSFTRHGTTGHGSALRVLRGWLDKYPLTQSGSLIACSDSKQQTQHKSMKLNEILNGRLEEEIREGLARLAEVAPNGSSPRIYVSASTNANHGYVAADIEGVHGLNAFGCNSIPDAVGVLISKIASPEAIERRRHELQDKIARLQTELDLIPAPLSIVRDESATVGA